MRCWLGEGERARDSIVLKSVEGVKERGCVLDGLWGRGLLGKEGESGLMGE